MRGEQGTQDLLCGLGLTAVTPKGWGFFLKKDQFQGEAPNPRGARWRSPACGCSLGGAAGPPPRAAGPPPRAGAPRLRRRPCALRAWGPRAGPGRAVRGAAVAKLRRRRARTPERGRAGWGPCAREPRAAAWVRPPCRGLPRRLRPRPGRRSPAAPPPARASPPARVPALPEPPFLGQLGASPRSGQQEGTRSAWMKIKISRWG